MNITFFQIIVLIGFVNSCILLASLASLPDRYRTSAKFMGLFILLQSLSLSTWTVLPALQKTFIWLCIMRIPVVFFMGPVFLFFAKSLNHKNYKLSKREFLHFIPGMLDIILTFGMWVYIYFFALEYKFSILRHQTFYIFHEGVAVLFSAVYLVMIWEILRKKSVNLEAKSFYGLFSYGITLILILWSTYYFIELYQYPDPVEPHYYYPFWVLILSFYLFVGHKALINPKRLRLATVTKYNSENLQATYVQVKQLIAEKKMFLNPDLEFSEVVKDLGMSNNIISKSLSIQGSFSDLLNQLRVEEFLEKLNNGEDEKLTLFSLAQESGFNSRATFYRAFKKHTGKTPSEYKKYLLSNT